MKGSFLTCLVMLFLLVACEKTNFISSSTLTGKWQLEGYYYSPGGPLIYQEADKNTRSYIEFGEDGKLQFEGSGYSSYRLKDSVTITFIKDDRTEFDYFYKISENKLSLSPRTQMCIEGCSSIYRKLEE